MQLHDLLYFMQAVNRIMILRTFLKENPKERAYIEADTLWINNKIRSYYNTHFLEFFHTYVYGTARDDQLFCNIGVRNSSIIH
ncbi:hypothetical protein D3C80_1150890 [compost metagenome]